MEVLLRWLIDDADAFTMPPLRYAQAASKNRLPPDQQPHPDQSLLEGDHNLASGPGGDLSHSKATDEKVHVVSREEFDEDTHPADEDHLPAPPRFNANDAVSTSDLSPTAPSFKPSSSNQTTQQQKGKDTKDAAKDLKDSAKDTKDSVKDYAKEKLDSSDGNADKAKSDVKENADEAGAEAKKQIDKGTKVAKEEYEELSEKAKAAYNKMSKEAQDDWQKLSAESKKRWAEAKNSDAGRELQKPQVWGPLLAGTNAAVLGTVLYFTYANWHKPRWDRRVVSATVIGIGTWFGLQGPEEEELVLSEQSEDDEEVGRN
ncbi:MAG: hypothetical protein CYPHOPRED_004816 [Cyphobasidiales sp. Tagirdzhanova-0007]|nr:MAG: hypothetical protein CYPHOPRED_004816 [Cyphobasidiales sp. Tagirdzhanova-0007]